jgi:hypothetical protein
MCYLVTELYHSVEVCHRDNPRTLFMFGFVVDKDSWNNQTNS